MVDKEVLSALEKKGIESYLLENIENKLFLRYKQQLLKYLTLISLIMGITGLQVHSWLSGAIEIQVDKRVNSEIQKTRDIGKELTKTMIESMADMTSNVTKSEVIVKDIQDQLVLLKSDLSHEINNIKIQKQELEKRKLEIDSLLKATRSQVNDLEARIEELENKRSIYIPNTWINLYTFKSTYSLGINLHKSGNEQQAVLILENALYQLLNLLGVSLQEKDYSFILSRLRDHPSELQYLSSKLFNMLSWLYLQNNTHRKERIILSRLAVSLDDNANYLETLADIYFSLGKYKQAIDTIKKAIEKKNDKAYHDKLDKYLQYYN